MDLNSALARAQKLILDENFNNKVEGYASRMTGKSARGSAINDLSSFEKAAFGNGFGGGSSNEGIELLQEAPRSLKNSGLPKNIAESFEKMPPVNFYQPSTAEALYTQPQAAPQYTPQVPQQTAAIDYEYLKYIIEGVVKNVLSDDENGVYAKAMRIKDGNTIQFLDSKGNVYEGVLKLKKKAK